MKLPAGFLAAALVLAIAAPAAAAPTATGEAAGESCSFPLTTTDASGTEVTIREEPSRVVTLGPSAAQTAWEIGAREKVVGVTKYADYLDGAESRTQVSTSEEMVSHEAVVDLEPDLVLAPHVVPNQTVEALREAGVTVYAFPEAESVEDVHAKTRRVGRLTGECRGAEETVAWMEERVEVVRDAVEGRERPDVLYLFLGYTAGEDTFIHEIVETAGGNNVAADVNVSGYRQLNPEVVVSADPDWIVRNSENPIGVDPAVYNRTAAGRENRTVVLQIEHVNQPAPRIVHAITTLAEHFHPEAYARANATSTPTATDSTTPGQPSPNGTDRTTSATSPVSPTEAPGQPGFGAIVGVLGLAGAGLLRQRR